MYDVIVVGGGPAGLRAASVPGDGLDECCGRSAFHRAAAEGVEAAVAINEALQRREAIA